ncbi:hypothetical protein [Desulfuromonas acetoxidans]|uniref:toxin-antitoxin system YwqK family antitoxin n=1 Tax=Desulfuromonas acetoxidans TaxID=891 RepID=UPI002931BC06|nr:hypothetical protein [Desulfuromonas acetoxidans]
MRRSVLFILLLSLSVPGFAVMSREPQAIYDSDDVVELHETLYDKHSREKIDGVVESYSDSGVLLQELVCVDWRPHGITREYYDSGALKSEISYRDGLYDGLSKFYYETGGLEFEVPSRNDLVHGTMIRYNQDGSIASQECYVDGVLQKE